MSRTSCHLEAADRRRCISLVLVAVLSVQRDGQCQISGNYNKYYIHHSQLGRNQCKNYYRDDLVGVYAGLLSTQARHVVYCRRTRLVKLGNFYRQCAWRIKDPRFSRLAKDGAVRERRRLRLRYQARDSITAGGGQLTDARSRFQVHAHIHYM